MINGPLFSIGSLSVWPYGLCMGIGIVCCFVFLYLTMVKRNYNEEAIDKTLIIGVCATAFGVFMAAVVQGLYNVIAGNGFDLKSMTFYGGLIGGVSSFLIVWNLYVYVIAPRAKSKLLKNNMNAALSDSIPFIPIGITIAHAFGRLGCTLFGCCHGGETDAWYGIFMYSGNTFATKVVPTQLWECIFLVALSLVMALLYFKFRFKYNFPVYMISYGIWRFIIEYVRTDYRGEFIPGLTPSQFWSIIMVVGGIGFIFLQKYVLIKLMKHPELQPLIRVKKGEAKQLGDGEENLTVIKSRVEVLECDQKHIPQSAQSVHENCDEEVFVDGTWSSSDSAFKEKSEGENEDCPQDMPQITQDEE